jgi:hypothetical protein
MNAGSGGGAVATVDPLGGPVVVVVAGTGVEDGVEDGVTDDLVMTLPPGVATGPPNPLAVDGLTEPDPEPDPGPVVVVPTGAEVAVEVEVDVEGPRKGAVAEPWRRSGPWWPEVAAATRASRESETASTAHQCGRIRSGRVPRGPLLGRSPGTG